MKKATKLYFVGSKVDTRVYTEKELKENMEGATFENGETIYELKKVGRIIETSQTVKWN